MHDNSENFKPMREGPLAIAVMLFFAVALTLGAGMRLLYCLANDGLPVSRFIAALGLAVGLGILVIALRRLAIWQQNQNLLRKLLEQIEANPKDMIPRMQHGRLLMSLSQPEEALIDFQAALEINSSNAEAHLWHGHALYALEDRDAALAAFDRAIELHPDHVEALIERASIYLDAGRPDDAEKDFARVAEIEREKVQAEK